MADINPEVNLTVKNIFSSDGSKEHVRLSFQDMKDFEPEAGARQIPQLKAMLAMRNLLRDLKSNLLDNTMFKRELEKIVKNPALSNELLKELNVLAWSQE